MFELAIQDVGEDLHIAMGMGAEAGGGGDAVLVDDAQGVEVEMARILVVGEGESVAGVEPAVVGGTAIFGPANGTHEKPPERKVVADIVYTSIIDISSI
jgi:hypothetical protein